ncbi:PE-PGRS family protein [Streptomyces sp. NPDC048288]|uniref:PE-PGRS family protein n=1 Tax=Streptomyces sp. NPDC048288 TaxID=3365529 RepID=UPI00371F6713
MGNHMRMVNPDDLDQLAKLIDGRGGVVDKLDEAFTRAAALGVSEKVTRLRPMRSWAAETAPDLRKRAAVAREDQLFERGDRETYSDWLARIEAHYLAKVPGLDRIPAEDIEEFLNDVGDVTNVIKIGGTTMLVGAGMSQVLFKNSWYNGVLREVVNSEWWENGGRARNWAAASLRELPAGELRSLSAPGSWLPGQLGNLFSRSTLYQRASRIPFTAGRRADLLSQAWNGFRALPVVNSPMVAKGIDFLVGSDELAMAYGGVTHSEALVSRAGQVNLLRVFRSASYIQKLNNARPAVIAAGKTASPFLKGVGAAARAGGFIRYAGIGGGLIATGISAANVWAQGNPREAYKKKGAGYVADVAELGFNASLTAAMIAPNPVTVGLTIGTGLIYAGAEVVDHWDDIKAGTGQAVEWADDAASKAGEGLAHGARAVAKAANPMNWFD